MLAGRARLCGARCYNRPVEKFLIVGGGGREGAFALKCAEEVSVCAVMDHPNPTIMDCVRRTGGVHLIGKSADAQTVLEFAQKNKIDYAFVNSDAPLANGVVDALLAQGIRTVGGTKDASRIEWDKIYSIDLVKQTSPEHTPFYRVAESESDLDDMIGQFQEQNMEMVVKPQGLTGGKGVKVMPEHLKNYQECRAYAAQLLRAGAGQEKVLLTEKLDGIEFTIMGFTDGKTLVLAPATYDYPYRHENDSGPGTGGMGCFTAGEKKLPFMSDRDWEDCGKIMQRAVDEMRVRGAHFTGVLNGGFFKTERGIRFMEFNGRFGDPEALNILMILQDSFPALLRSLANGTLRGEDVGFIPQASVVKYLVSPEYPNPGKEVRKFKMDHDAIGAAGIKVFCASCQADDAGGYQTLNKPSRVVAFGCTADTIEDAARRIDAAMKDHVCGDLDFRRDIGSRSNIELLTGRFAG